MTLFMTPHDLLIQDVSSSLKTRTSRGLPLAEKEFIIHDEL
jgi:hypothetical protein